MTSPHTMIGNLPIRRISYFPHPTPYAFEVSFERGEPKLQEHNSPLIQIQPGLKFRNLRSCRNLFGPEWVTWVGSVVEMLGALIFVPGLLQLRGGKCSGPDSTYSV